MTKSKPKKTETTKTDSEEKEKQTDVNDAEWMSFAIDRFLLAASGGKGDD